MKTRTSASKTRRAEFGPVITFRNWRAIIFASLTGGVTYVMELIGLSGSTGQGDSSEPISKITL